MKPWKRLLAVIASEVKQSLMTDCFVAALLAMTAFTFVAVAEARDPQISEQDLLALLSYDLGPATIDVSAYSPHYKETYDLFMRKCSLCHTPARAINFPTVTKEDWTRFLMTMHGRAKGTLLETGEAQRLAEFLAYDSAQRKLKDPEAFARLQEQLDRRFEAVKQERSRREGGKNNGGSVHQKE